MPNLQQFYQSPEIQEAQNVAQTTATQAAAYQSASALLPQKLKQAINEKLDYNRGIIEAKNKAAAEYFQAPSAAREKYQDVFNPFQREALVTEERTQAYQPYANLVDILGQRTGSISDIIESATGLFQSDVLAKESAAGISRQGFQDEVGLAELLADAAYKEESLDIDRITANKTATGDDDALSKALIQIQEMNTGQDLDGDGLIGGVIPVEDDDTNVPELTEPTEPKPQVSESQKRNMLNRPEVMWRSPGGQWIFDFASNDWVQIID